ncbi:hypothetical protein C2S53_020841, partial [Perilla frutescens var. hirtella]
MADHGGKITTMVETNSNIPEPQLEPNLREDDDVEMNEIYEEGESERKDEYNFQFNGKIDPLSFVKKEDTSGLPLYQVFMRIEDQYNSLAKKRPAPDNNQSEMSSKRLRQEEDNIGASLKEIEKAMNFGVRKRKSRKASRRGRRKGSKNKVSPELTKKIGEATLHYAQGLFDKAICLLHEVIRLAPNLSDPYQTLGVIYDELCDKKRSMSFNMIAAHLAPKNAFLWKLLLARSRELGDNKQAFYYLRRAIIADPKDINLQLNCASLYDKRGEYQKAADCYQQISRICPDNIEVLHKLTQLYQKCDQHERAMNMLEENLKRHMNVARVGVVDLLVSVLMENGKYARTLEHIEQTQQDCTGIEIPLDLITKAGICHVHLGHNEKAELPLVLSAMADSACFKVLKQEGASNHSHLIIDVANSLMSIRHHDSALKYYMIVEEDSEKYDGYLHLKIARCYVSLKKDGQAIEYYKKAVPKLHDSIDARLLLSSLLLQECRDDEAIYVISPQVGSDSDKSDTRNLWQHSGKIKLKLSQIYKSKGLIDAFVDVLFPVIHDTLFVKQNRQKVKRRRRLTRSVLSERTEVLNDDQYDRVLHGLWPFASSAALSKASRAKKVLQKKAILKEAERAEALAAGFDYNSDSDDSDDESPQEPLESAFPEFLDEERNHLLIVDLCKSLSSLRRYSSALGIVKISLKLDVLSAQTKMELRTIGAQLEAIIADPVHGWDLVRDFVSWDPYSISAWNSFYKVILRRNQLSRRSKLLHSMRVKHKDDIPPILISRHQFTMISQHQIAAREYLQAYKLMPDNPLINLCGGTALINLSLGHRLKNKHLAFLQGLAFLYTNLRLCGDSREALYNIARAYHHVGLVSLASTYYEKVLATREKDYPIPTLPHKNQNATKIKMAGYSDLRREAAFNLHLIYKRSGAFDLARQ